MKKRGVGNNLDEFQRGSLLAESDKAANDGGAGRHGRFDRGGHQRHAVSASPIKQSS